MFGSSKGGRAPRKCIFYAEGRCMRGEGCRFSHDLAAQPSGPNRAEGLLPTLKSLSIQARLEEARTRDSNQGSNDTKHEACKYWMLGSCWHGSGCRFSHEVAPTFGLASPQNGSRKSDTEVSWRAREPPIEHGHTILREVDDCLVTFGAGLCVEGVTASFDVTRGRLTGLPAYLEVEDITNHLSATGIKKTCYTLHKPMNNNFVFITMSSDLSARLLTLPPLDDCPIKFIPSKSAPDDTQSSAFGRTLIVQIPLSTPPSVTRSLTHYLETKARRFGFRSISTETPPAGAGSDKRIRIITELDSWDHARDLRDALRRQGTFTSNRHEISFKDFFLPSKYRYPLFMSASQYEAQESRWDELALRCKKDNCQLKFKNLPGRKFQITLLGNELSSVGPMKIRAEQLARGSTINLWNRRFFDNDVAQQLTDEVRAATDALVQVDRRFKCLRVYGSSLAVDRAREKLQKDADQLSKTEYVRELSSAHTVRLCFEHVYPQLTETYGEDAVRIDLTSNPKKIVVTGDEEIRHRLNKLFDESIRDWSYVNTTDNTKDNQECPICMCPVTVPTALDCGHVYCTQCLTHLVKSALDSTSFPLTCSADEGRCGTPLAIPLLEKFLPVQKFRQLLEYAFHAYLEQNPDVISPCKTPGCSQLYTRDLSGSSDGSKVVSCPSCFVSACVSCGRNAHQGTSCEEARRDLSEDYIDKSSEIQRCPSCQTPILKDGGCNHVSCRCGKHICWRCMEVFTESQLCYQHMTAQHGGCFDTGIPGGTARTNLRNGRALVPAVPAELVEEDLRAREAMERRNQFLGRRGLSAFGRVRRGG